MPSAQFLDLGARLILAPLALLGVSRPLLVVTLVLAHFPNFPFGGSETVWPAGDGVEWSWSNPQQNQGAGIRDASVQRFSYAGTSTRQIIAASSPKYLSQAFESADSY